MNGGTKEVVPVFLEKLSLFITTSKSTTRTVINSAQKRILRYFINIGIVIISVGITIFGLSEGLSPPQIKEVEIKIKGLHPDLEGFSIVQISDLHISPSNRRNWLEQLVDQINVLSPDIVALTGDISDSDYSQIHTDVAPLSKLRARYGKFFVTGNHEYMASSNMWTGTHEYMAGSEIWKRDFVIEADKRLSGELKNLELIEIF